MVWGRYFYVVHLRAFVHPFNSVVFHDIWIDFHQTCISIASLEEDKLIRPWSQKSVLLLA